MLNKARDLAILRFAAKVSDAEVCSFATDRALFFMQFATYHARRVLEVRAEHLRTGLHG